MKVYIGKDINIKKYMKKHNMKAKLIRFDNYSIDRVESFVDDFLFKNANTNNLYILYNTCVMDYLPTNCLYYIDDELNEHLSSEYFKDKLDYMYPGELLYNLFS